MPRLRFLFLLLATTNLLSAQSWKQGNYHSPWTDSIISRMSLKQQIAQMMMVAAWSNKGNDHIEEIDRFIDEYQIGGLIFFQGDPLRQAYLTNYYQQNSKIPLMIGIDGEWGLAMRLKYVQKYPYQMTLGAAHNDELVYRTGLAMGNECKRLGIHVNFAPDIDVNTNPENPIIGFRSFGEETDAVTRFGVQMMKGLQDAGIMACAKHFPGHGDSRADSHLELPLITHDLSRLNTVELMPFKGLFEAGVQSTMVGHLEIPALDTTPHLPSSLSPRVVTDLLQKEMGFNGLIFTDALNMKGVTRYFQPGYAEAAAILAGNDVLLFPENVPAAIQVILDEVTAGRIDSATIAAHVLKILYFKQQAGLDRYTAIETSELMQDLNNTDAILLDSLTAEQAVTVVCDQDNRIPLPHHTNKRVALWAIGKSGQYAFTDEVLKFQPADVFFTHRDSGYAVFAAMSDSISRHYDEVIISIHEWNLWGKKSQSIPQPIVQNIYYLTERKPSVVVLFSNLYLLKNLPNLSGVLVAYEDHPEFQKAAARVLFGKITARGWLPAAAGNGYQLHSGIFTEPVYASRFEKTSPTEAGFKKDFSPELNALLKSTHDMGAAPGGQVLVLKNGKEVYNETWGHREYGGEATNQNDLYDLASITKVTATTLAIMKLVESNKIKPDAPLYLYMPEFKGTDKAKISIRSLLLHESGLPPFIPFFKNALTVPGVFNNVEDSVHSRRISNSLWMNPEYEKQMWSEIRDCAVKSKPAYTYSDLNFILLGEVVKRVSKVSLDEYVQNTFYSPMRLNRLLFHPLNRYDTTWIVPTTIDNYFRNEKVQGYVHDPGAAMFGGVAGHAGLFSNASDLAVLFQMLLNGGTWNGVRYLKEETIADFTQAGHRKTHRGLGFDKPNGQKGDHANVSEKVPAALFGHSGFTGNWAWADPENDLVFIFLSNRTYPDETNRKLIQNNIRTRAIEIVYSALGE